MSLLRIGGKRLKIGNRLLAVGSGANASPSFANMFSVAISTFSGIVGTNVIVTVAPIGGVWPANQPVYGTYSGAGGSFASASVAAGSTSAVSFTGSFNTASSGMINATIAGMTSTGGQTYTSTAPQSTTPTPSPTPTSIANRYDVILDQSTVSPGDTVTGKVWLNGLTPTGTVSLLIAGVTTTVTLPSTGFAATAFSFVAPTTPGEYSVTPTNSAGMFNPYPPPLNVFALSSGTARTIAASFAMKNGNAQYDQAVYQQDAIAGTPRGFTSGNWGHGWTEGWMNVSSISGPTNALYARPYSAFSSGATSTAGTGTPLDGAVQIYGPISSAKLIRPLWPAGPRMAYWDVATSVDSNGNLVNPVRIAQRIGCGHVVGLIGRSIMRAQFGSDPFGANSTPLYTNYPDALAYFSGDYRFGGGSTNPSDYPSGIVQWFREDGVSVAAGVNGSGDGSSSATQERARFFGTGPRGVIVGVVGCGADGTPLCRLVAHDGTPCDGFKLTLAAITDGKVREVQIEGVSYGNEWDDTTYPETVVERITRFKNFVAWMAARYSAPAVYTIHAGLCGWYGSDGSQNLGCTRTQAQITMQMAAVDPRISSRAETTWNERGIGHPTMASRIPMMGSIYGQYEMAESIGWGGRQIPYAQRGPSFAPTGTIKSGSNVIRVGVKLNGGTVLSPHKFVFNNAAPAHSTTVSAGELASIFGVYPLNGRFAGGTPVQISSAVINTANPPSGYDCTIDLTLVVNSDGTLRNWANDNGGNPGSQPFPSTFMVQPFDFATSNMTVTVAGGSPGTAVFLTDDINYINNGVLFGREIQPLSDIAISTVN